MEKCFNNNNSTTSYKELVKKVQYTKKDHVVFLGNAEIPFELDLCKLLEDAGICKRITEQSTLELNCSLLLENIKCKELLISSICFKDSCHYFIVRNSCIDSIRIYSCHFNLFKIDDSTIPELTIVDSFINEDAFFDFYKVPAKVPIRANLEDSVFYGNVVIANLKMINKNSEILLNGSRLAIYGDFILSHLWLLLGKIDLSCEFKQNCIFRDVNSGQNENGQPITLNNGEISINGGHIAKELAFECCHLDCLCIANTSINGTREFDFSYNQLKYDAATVLRDGASKKNNVVLIERHTAEVFDVHLKSRAKQIYTEWINSLEKKKVRIESHRKRLYTIMLEPIVLFIPSLTSGESFLLWMHKYSNDFNRSWLRGIVFTLLVTLLSYFILNYTGRDVPYFVIDIHFNGFGDVVKGYLRLLDVFNLTGIANNVFEELTTWGYIQLFVSKIVITFGFWQTIYAFFRYRK